LNAPCAPIHPRRYRCHTDRLVVACSRCNRRDRCSVNSVARLIVKYGPDKSGVELLRELSADCPHRESTSWQERYDPHCPELAALFKR
jgi:hypothetical protein